ncbi:hypothetical protein CONCODRAFT_11856 [Conidiobolus coronatus NRRL 28638]|uniref:G-protein coupled receptors family 1 profile domain-containing protein n=1 Tax=Conidiobolus coronatus (strain ATCC 28846 / CBS 209.66 / NRRL 28638) TaxID=796925 RepID=A0A137NUB0_CONC2|nr:hypothetical protein CONCODRAFT_11856 [Conidiobolus coronatus NRRL 28638]|eukprot:KXN66336.1 hypothetical protein CONCODRAFT_11856 [Conidiobolus coronatus NRRL 28638]
MIQNRDRNHQLENPSITISTETIMFFISILGLFFNGIAVYISHYKLKSRNESVWLMSIIGVVDILVSLTILIADILKYSTGFNILYNNAFCQFTGAAIMSLTMTTIDGVGLLSLLRALSIVKNIEIRAVYWYSAMSAMIAYNLVINILGIYNNIMYVMPAEVYCHAAFNANSYAVIFSYFILTKFVIMIVILMASYICITIKYCQIISPLNSKSRSNECFIGDTSSISFQRAMVCKLLSLLVMYIICFGPMVFTVLYNVATKTFRSPIADAICGITMNLTVLVNAVFVLLYQKEARLALFSMLPSWIISSESKKKCPAYDNLQI